MDERLTMMTSLEDWALQRRHLPRCEAVTSGRPDVMPCCLRRHVHVNQEDFTVSTRRRLAAVFEGAPRVVYHRHHAFPIDPPGTRGHEQLQTWVGRDTHR